jgi:predicted DNA-binding protein
MKMVLSFKVPAWIKEALQELAEKEHRPVSNYILTILIKHLEERGIKPPKTIH